MLPEGFLLFYKDQSDMKQYCTEHLTASMVSTWYSVKVRQGAGEGVADYQLAYHGLGDALPGSQSPGSFSITSELRIAWFMKFKRR